MITLIALRCHVCNGTAGVGHTVEHAEWNSVESGGRRIADLRVCGRCARHTR